MQPYFLPYIGYFQLVGAVDLFILHDDVKYTKKGWINRNRILRNGTDAVITVPLKAGSDALAIREREVAGDFRRDKLLNQVREAYARAPHFAAGWALAAEVLGVEDLNLAAFLDRSIAIACRHLGLQTPIKRSSAFGIGPHVRAQERVLALCRAAGATAYLNPIGGTELYSREDFRAAGIELGFLRTRPLEYAQFGGAFVPWLSILDVIMFNPADVVDRWLRSHYEVV